MLTSLIQHKTFSFNHPAAYALAQTVVDIPLVLIQVLLFLITILFMAHVSVTASQFFIAVLTVWLVTMVTVSGELLRPDTSGSFC